MAIVRNFLGRLGLHLVLGFFLAGCTTPLAGIGAALESLEHSDVFQPARYPEGVWKLAGFEFEDAWFAAEDGTRLNGWYCHQEDPIAVFLIAHGESGNVTGEADLLRMLRNQHKVAALAFDYRGYGKSDGEPGFRGVIEDARAARAWLARRTNFAERDIVLLGQSLGAGVVVNLAAEEGARGLVLVNAFPEVVDVVRRPVFFPVRSRIHTPLDAIASIGKYHGALLQIQRDNERSLPVSLGPKLFVAANEPKRLIVERAPHNAMMLTDREGQALDAFLTSLPAAKPLPPPPRWHKAGARRVPSPAELAPGRAPVER